MIKYLFLSFPLLILCILNCSLNPEKDVFRFGVGNLNYKNDCPLELSSSIINANCDIFICLEWTSKNLDKRQLKNAGYHFLLDFPKSGTHGICIIGKDKIITKASIQKPPINGPCAIPFGIVRTKINERYISILGVHVPPPVESCKNTTDTSIVELSKFIKDGKIFKDIGIARKNDIAIIAGDFNALSINKAFKSIRRSGLIDSYRKNNVFPGPTWSPKSWIPAFLRIDYIFVSEMIKPVKSIRFNLPKSDHKGIVTEFILDEAP